MRRISRLFEPVVDSTAGRVGNQGSLPYVCTRCIQRNAATRLPVRASPFSTSARSTYAAIPSFKDVSNALSGKSTAEEPEESEEHYSPATTSEGLEWVGTKAWYEKRRRPQQDFSAYGPIQAPLKDRMHLRDELLKAIIEVSIIKKLSPRGWQHASTQISWIDFPRAIRIGCDRNTHEPVFEFGDQEAEAKLITQLQKTSPSTPKRASQLSQIAEQHPDGEVRLSEEERPAEPVNDIFRFADLEDQKHGKWSSISLEDLKTRFAVAKRVQQQTGVRLTDPQITHSKSAGAMFAHLWKPEKPKKLAELLLSNQELASLPNVKISDRKITMADREREVGRWKVIEEELVERGITTRREVQ